MKAGTYRYVKYDRRNGPIKVGTMMFLVDPVTFEVDLGKSGGSPVGVSLIATEWTWWEQMMWRFSGFPELGKWSPIRFLFVQQSNYGVTEYDPVTGCWPNAAVDEDGKVKEEALDDAFANIDELTRKAFVRHGI